MAIQTWPRSKKAILLVSPLVVLFLSAEVVGRLLERYAGISFYRSAGYRIPNSYVRSALVPGYRLDTGDVASR